MAIIVAETKRILLTGFRARLDIELDFRELAGASFCVDIYGLQGKHPETHLGFWDFDIKPVFCPATIQIDFSSLTQKSVLLEIGEQLLVSERYWVNEAYYFQPQQELKLVVWKRGQVVELHELLLEIPQKKDLKRLQQRPWAKDLSNVEMFFVELTNVCNFRCSFCPESIMTREKGFMDFALAKKIMDDIAQMRYKRPHLRQVVELRYPVALHLMGEPLLYPYLFEVIEYAKTKGIELILFTNGGLLTEQSIDRLIELELRFLVLSLQTPSRELFSLRDAPIPYEAYLETIRKVIKRKVERGALYPRIEVHFLNTKLTRPKGIRVIDDNRQTKEVALSWLDFAHQLAREFHIVPKNSSSHDLEHLLDLRGGEEYLEILEGVNLVFKGTTTFANYLLEPGIEIIGAEKGYCPVDAPYKQLGILWNGDCTCCCLDFDGRINIGNAAQESLEDIWFGAKIERIRRAMNKGVLIEPLCQRCRGTPLNAMTPENPADQTSLLLTAQDHTATVSRLADQLNMEKPGIGQLGEGWYPAARDGEKGYRWTGKRATFSLRNSGKPYLYLELHGYLGRCARVFRGRVRGVVRVNGIETGRFSLLRRRWKEIRLSLPKLESEILRIEIEVDRTWRATDYPLGKFPYPVGVALHQATLTE